MAKRRKTKSRAIERRPLDESAKLEERRRLQRARQHQRRVTQLARALGRATPLADRARIHAMSVLASGTHFKLMPREELERWQRQHDADADTIRELRETIKQLENMPAADHA